jgi:hypothetical protein
MAYSIEGGDLYNPVPQGGTVKTFYNESDRPAETQVYSAEGQMMQRLVQSFDAAGRPTETKVVLGDIAAMLPAETKAQLLNEPGAGEEMQRQVAELFGPQGEMFKMSYVYDTDGRLTEKRSHMGYNEETVTSYVYDSNGNKIRETSKTSGDANPPRNDAGLQNATAGPDRSREESEVTYITRTMATAIGPSRPCSPSRIPVALSRRPALPGGRSLTTDFSPRHPWLSSAKLSLRRSGTSAS